MHTLAGRLRRLTAADWRALADSIGLALTIELWLRRMPLSTLVERLGRSHAASAAPAPPTAADARRLARIAAAPYRVLPIPSTCLRESLVLYALLRRRGGPAVLQLGVRKSGVSLDAHAWVAYAGITIGESDVAAYGPLEPARAASAAAFDR